ncbi:hypothetical protein ABZ863_24545 [Saccharomonospora sp. NPDC046836]|uniref:hypothetical protein n=1 Tax=Saccharomonospora sp. NPDC046836 TaxID=3156921 RepID=UPI003404E7D0
MNPSTNPTAHDLRGSPDTGAGRHWWRKLRPYDFYDHQLPEPVGPCCKPDGW